MSRPIVRVLFVLLALATAGAFVLTQKLKRSTPVVERVFFPRYLSPNGDHLKDTATVRFDLRRRDHVTVSIVDESGNAVRRLADDRPLGKGTHTFVWNGRTDSGRLAPDGDYRLRVALRDEGRGLTAARALVLDTTPPRPRIVAVTPHEIVPGGPPRRARARIRFQGPSDPAPVFRVYRTDDRPPHEVARFTGTRFRRTGLWDGKVNGRPAPDGTYAIAVTVRDRALVAGSAPRRLPPRRAEARADTGVSVRYLTIQGPLEPVKAGHVARLAVGPTPRTVRWRLQPLGSGKPIASGRTPPPEKPPPAKKDQIRAGTHVKVKVPGSAKTGLYLLRAQVGAHVGSAPVAVRGAANGRAQPGRVLAVLPTILWQATTKDDDNFDGFPDTLDDSKAVSLNRPLAHARLPASVAMNVAPLLAFLGREKLAYDVTTDVALARSGGAGLRRYAGILFTGSERWVPPRLDQRLREYVEGGGDVVDFGADAFKRSVQLRHGVLRDPIGPRAVDTFGEETRSTVTPSAPLVVFGDRLHLFSVADHFVGEFTRLEVSEQRPGRARLESSAGRERRTPAFVAFKLGFGLVIRVGAPGWSTLLPERTGAIEVADVTRRIVKLVSRPPTFKGNR